MQPDQEPSVRAAATLGAAGALLPPRTCRAQDIEPQRWYHLLIGANCAGAGYAGITGDISLETALQIASGQIEAETFGLQLIRSFKLIAAVGEGGPPRRDQPDPWSGPEANHPAP